MGGRMVRTTVVPIKKGGAMEVSFHRFPLAEEVRRELLPLLYDEWPAPDYDLAAAAAGEYARTLTIVAALGRIDGRVVGTAQSIYAARQPELAMVGFVLTRGEYRGQGIGAKITVIVTDFAFEAGCKAAFLGSNIRPDCVYLRAGYSYYNGGVMRRLAEDGEDLEAEYFRPGQSVQVRPAEWGDLPGTGFLLIRPYEWVVGDYQRGFFSGRYTTQRRCVSNFPYVYYSIEDQGGVFMVLTGDRRNRVLGMATVTPNRAAIQKHAAVLDFLSHRNYYSALPHLVEETLAVAAKTRSVEQVTAYVAQRDVAKADILIQLGFRELGVLPCQLRHEQGEEDVHIFHKDLSTGRD
jgi:GNAT superfamily N-acetyltransferase